MIRHNKEECILSAKTCKTKEEFKKKFRNQHAAAIHNGWYTECIQHMPDQSQTKYKTSEDILNYIDDNNITRYKDLPKGLIRKAKQLNLLNIVKNKVQCGPTEKTKYRKAPNSSRPRNIEEWFKKLQEIGITLISKDYQWSEEDSTGRKYLSLEIQCNNTFDSNNENHPSIIQRITNIERNLKSKKSCCPYCIKTFYISNSNSKNHHEDIKRNFDILQIWAKKNDIYINPKQDFSKSSQKVICTDIKSGKEKKILLSSILRSIIDNPFSAYDRMNERFKIKYKTVKEACISKGFELITTETEYNQLTIKDKTQYSPSTRKIEFKWNGIKYKYPIGQIIKPLWLPQDLFISEEIVRYQFTKFFKFKFEFKKVKPDTLIGKKNRKLELDGYCENVYGEKIAFEHQGKQHYSNMFAGKKIDVIENDILKKKWCIENNIILIEIRELGKHTPIMSLPNLIKEQLSMNNIIFPEEQIDNSIDLTEINNYLNKLIPKRLKAIENKLKIHNIKLTFRGINKRMLFQVKLTNKHEITRMFFLTTIEKWEIQDIIKFSNMNPKNMR